jgi:endonuclease YncB( thermonuclease family)
MRRCLPIVLAVALAPTAAVGAEAVPGPINARVVSVYDGDTMTVDAEPWPGLTARTSVRVAGVDTPEIQGACQAEKDMAIRARDFVRAMVGAQVQLTDVRLGKYAGRVVADVWVNEQKLSDLLVAENLGRPYHGGRREGWCP